MARTARLFLIFSVFVINLALVGCGSETTPPQLAELVLKNGKIVTVDDLLPVAQALAVVDDRIVAVGSDSDIEPLIGPDTEVIDLAGQLAIPGFIEGHGHFTGLGQAKMILDLTTATSWDDIVEQVVTASASAPAGAWILGRGWHQEKWQEVPWPSVEGLPLHNELSERTPDNPVLLTHASGHGSFANAKALELANISRETDDPPGGTIVRDEQGAPTGALREKAQLPVRVALQKYQDSQPQAARRAEALKAVQLASYEALSKGVTSFHDAGSSFETIDFFKELADNGDLPLRLYVMARYGSVAEMDEKLPEYRMVNAANGFLTVRSIKRQLDGALGSHGAWLLESYVDLENNSGLVLEPLDEVYRAAEVALKHGFQVNTHAIGDRANREVLDLYQAVFAKAGVDGRDLRWRIEHAQHIHPDDVPRFAQLGVIASMQGVHCTSDGPWLAKRLGEARTRATSYVWRDLINAGVVVTNGTDVPVEDIDPLASFYASVTRITKDGTVFVSEQVMTRAEALRSYTLNAAYSAFEEADKGSLTPGKYADIVVLSKDIMTVPAEEIRQAEVIYTIVGGKVKYHIDAT